MIDEQDPSEELYRLAVPPALDARVSARARAAFERECTREQSGHAALLLPIAVSAPVIVYLAWAIEFSAALLR